MAYLPIGTTEEPIMLVWADQPLPSLAYANDPPWLGEGECRVYDPAGFTSAIVTTSNKEGVTISGRKYSAVQFVYRSYEITLSSDDIDDGYDDVGGRYGNLGKSGIEFLRQFWCAPYKYVSVHKSDFRRVANDGGTLPLSYLDDLLIYPEIKLTLNEIEPLKLEGGKYVF